MKKKRVLVVITLLLIVVGICRLSGNNESRYFLLKVSQRLFLQGPTKSYVVDSRKLEIESRLPGYVAEFSNAKLVDEWLYNIGYWKKDGVYIKGSTKRSGTNSNIVSSTTVKNLKIVVNDYNYLSRKLLSQPTLNNSNTLNIENVWNSINRTHMFAFLDVVDGKEQSTFYVYIHPSLIRPYYGYGLDRFISDLFLTNIVQYTYSKEKYDIIKLRQAKDSRKIFSSNQNLPLISIKKIK